MRGGVLGLGAAEWPRGEFLPAGRRSGANSAVTGYGASSMVAGPGIGPGPQRHGGPAARSRFPRKDRAPQHDRALQIPLLRRSWRRRGFTRVRRPSGLCHAVRARIGGGPAATASPAAYGALAAPAADGAPALGGWVGCHARPEEILGAVAASRRVSPGRLTECACMAEPRSTAGRCSPPSCDRAHACACYGESRGLQAPSPAAEQVLGCTGNPHGFTASTMMPPAAGRLKPSGMTSPTNAGSRSKPTLLGLQLRPQPHY